MSFYYKISPDVVLDSGLANFKGLNSFNFISGESAILYSKINNVVGLAQQYFTKRIFGIEPHLIYYAEIPGPGLLNPHRDHGATTVANFYFDSNGSTTSFYRAKSGAGSLNYQGSASVQDHNIYDLDDLDEVCNFTAHDGDCYLLNVSEIHGVYSPNAGTRRFINMQWYGVDIDTVYNSILSK